MKTEGFVENRRKKKILPPEPIFLSLAPNSPISAFLIVGSVVGSVAGSGRALGGLCAGSVGLLFSFANTVLAAQVECGPSWASVDGNVLAAPSPSKGFSLRNPSVGVRS